MIFVKNPVPGKVKTRLAKDVGKEKAAEYYKKLLMLTRNVARKSDADKWLWYGDFINIDDLWPIGIFEKKIQNGATLGDRMRKAFYDAFEAGYKKVLIIGSDCPEMSTEILEGAYKALDEHEVVIGPAHDGGYYLLGMQHYYNLFDNVKWSTETVLKETLAKTGTMNLEVKILEELTDIDTIEDLKKFPQL